MVGLSTCTMYVISYDSASFYFNVRLLNVNYSGRVPFSDHVRKFLLRCNKITPNVKNLITRCELMPTSNPIVPSESSEHIIMFNFHWFHLAICCVSALGSSGKRAELPIGRCWIQKTVRAEI